MSGECGKSHHHINQLKYDYEAPLRLGLVARANRTLISVTSDLDTDLDIRTGRVDLHQEPTYIYLCVNVNEPIGGGGCIRI